MASKDSSPLNLLNCLLICVTLWSYQGSGTFAKLYRKPNIVLILTDDLDVMMGGLVSEFDSFRILYVQFTFYTLVRLLANVATKKDVTFEKCCLFKLTTHIPAGWTHLDHVDISHGWFLSLARLTLVCLDFRSHPVCRLIEIQLKLTIGFCS